MKKLAADSKSRRREKTKKTEGASGGGLDKPALIERIQFAVGVVILGVLICLHGAILVNTGGLWRDEANTARFATMASLSEIASNLQWDSFPVGATIAFRVWSFITTTDMGWRIAGFLVGALIVASFWLAGRLMGFGIPYWSMALFGFNVIAMRYGDSVRPYGLGTLFTVAALVFVWRAATSGKVVDKIAAAVAAILSVQCLFQDAFLIMAICLAGMAVAARRRDWKSAAAIAGAGGLAALSLIPYIGPIRTAQTWSVLVRPPINLDLLWGVLSSALSSSGWLIGRVWIASFALSFVLAIGAFLVWKQSVSEEMKDRLLFAGAALLGVAGFIGFLRAVSLATQPWYYIPLMAVCAVSIDSVLAVFASKTALRTGRALLAAIVAIVALPQVWQEAQFRVTDMDLIAAKLIAEAAKDDLIVVNPFYMGVSLQHAYRGPARIISVPPVSDITIHRYDLVKEKMAEEKPLVPVFDAIQKTLTSGNRLWWVGNIVTTPEGKTPISLPPAPKGPKGWQFEEYASMWNYQLGDFLNAHKVEVAKLEVDPPQPIKVAERPLFVVFKGWKP